MGSYAYDAQFLKDHGIEYTESVSYTHLDVYKRQTEGGGFHQRTEYFRGAGTQRESRNGTLHVLVRIGGTAVSYTHLLFTLIN